MVNLGAYGEGTRENAALTLHGFLLGRGDATTLADARRLLSPPALQETVAGLLLSHANRILIEQEARLKAQGKKQIANDPRARKLLNEIVTCYPRTRAATTARRQGGKKVSLKRPKAKGREGK